MKTTSINRKAFPEGTLSLLLITSEWFWGTCSDRQAVDVLDMQLASWLWGASFELSGRREL